jgi:hypothetical protein
LHVALCSTPAKVDTNFWTKLENTGWLGHVYKVLNGIVTTVRAAAAVPLCLCRLGL